MAGFNHLNDMEIAGHRQIPGAVAIGRPCHGHGVPGGRPDDGVGAMKRSPVTWALLALMVLVVVAWFVIG